MVCQAKSAQRIFDELGDPTLHTLDIIPGVAHNYFGGANGQEFFDLIQNVLLQYPGNRRQKERAESYTDQIWSMVRDTFDLIAN